MVLTLKHIARRLGKDIWPAAGICLAVLAGSAASAQTTCVKCFGPEQVYRCEAKADEPIPDQAVGLFCVSKIASEHAHAGCGVQRGAMDCGGLPVTYVYDENFGNSADGGDIAPNRTVNGEPATLRRKRQKRRGKHRKCREQGGHRDHGCDKRRGKCDRKRNQEDSEMSWVCLKRLLRAVCALAMPGRF
jgi:hypothetical protein